jgi:dCTP deaminase
MLKNDRWINAQAAAGMIEPFEAALVRHLEPEFQSQPVLSYGCSSYGYDIRLSAREFLTWSRPPCTRTKMVAISFCRPTPMAWVWPSKS